MKKILVVCAHPDDEVLGCGGTMAKFAGKGDKVFTLILGEGVTSRDDSRDPRKRKKEIAELKKSALKANAILGVKQVFFHGLADNRFDQIPLLDIIKIVEKTKSKISPDIVFTHFRKDLNKDHRIVYKAVLTACRPLADNTVKEMYSFEVLSSTEWNYPHVFNPNTFEDVSESMTLKIRALSCYAKELKKFPHPRSKEGVKVSGRYWGMKVGLRYAEAFENIRAVK